MDVVDSLSTAPGTDAVPSLDFDLITSGDTQNLWCEQCKVLKKNYEKLQEEHALSYNTLKKKIISTDLLIKKYKTKCEDYDQQTRKLEDVSRKQEQLQRESETLKTQLSAALRQIEPLKQEKLALEQDVKRRLQENQNLQDQVVAAESFKTQYEQLNSSLLEGRDKHEQEIKGANKKIRELEQSQQKQDTQLTKLKEENKTLKKENGRFQKKERKTEERLAKAQETIEKYRVILIQHGLLPKHDRLQRIRKGMESSGKVEESSSQEDDDLVDPGFVSDHDTDLNQTRNHSELNVTTKTLGIPHSVEDRQSMVDLQEEEGSLMEFPFTFSPLASVLSPLPPSPQSYRKEVEDNEDSDEDWDEMAKQMEREIVNMPPTLKRSPRKQVPPSPLLKDSQTTVMVASNAGPKILGSETGKYEKQVTVHNRKDRRNLKGSQEGILGELKNGGSVEMKGIKRITFVSEELETGGEMVNSEVALVNPKPILCGHHNSAFQKFSKTSPKQETSEGNKGDRPVVNFSSESGTTEDSRRRAGDQSLIHGKRVECLRQHAFRPVSVNQEESDSMGSMESTGFTSKLTEATCNSTESKSSSVNHNEDKDAYTNELSEINDPDVDIKSALSIRTLRKSLSLPGGEPPSNQDLMASPSSRKKRISSLPHGSTEKDSRKSMLNLKSVPESPRRSQRNKSGEVGQKFNEKSKTCAETTSKEKVQSKQKTPSRLTRSQTVLLSTNDVDPLCQRSRARMKIPSGMKRKEENSVKHVSEIKQGCVGEDDVNDKLGKAVIEDDGGDPESVRQMTCDKSMSRQDSLGFALRSPPVLKAPPIVLPCQEGRGVGTTSGAPQMETNSLTKDRHSKCSPKKQVEGLLVKNSKDNLVEKERKAHQSYSFPTNPETSAKSREKSGDKDMCVQHENTDPESIPSDNCSVDHSEKNSDREKEEGLVEEAELPRQGSMGFFITGESGVDPEKSASNSVSVKSMQTGVDPGILAFSGETIESGREDFIRSRKKSFGAHKEEADKEDENKGPGFVQQVQGVREREKIGNGDSLLQDSNEGNMAGDSHVELMTRDLHLQNINVEGHSGRVKDTGIPDSEIVPLLGESSRGLDPSVSHNLLGSCNSDVEAISHASNSSERNVRSVKQSKISETLVSCVLTKSVSKSADVKLSSEIKAQTKQQRDAGSSSNGANVQTIPASCSVSRQPPTSFPPEGSSSSSFPVYVPSLSKLVQRARLSSGVPSSTVVSPEMENLPAHPPTDNSSTPRSPSSLSTVGPVSPLPPSPFHFFLPNPISPLPPSPVKEVVPISPLCTSPFDVEDPVPVHSESSESHKTIQVLSTKTSISSSSSSSIRKTSILNQCQVSSHNAKGTRTSQSTQSKKKLVQSDASPCTFHAVAPPDAIPVKAQTAVTQKSGSELSTTRKRRGADNKVSDVEVMEKKQCLENNTSEKKGAVNKNNNVDLYKVIEAEMKHLLQGSEKKCQETIEKLVLLADHSTISSHLLQWTIQFLRCQEVELFGTIHCYCAYSSDCQSRTDPFLTQGEARLLQFYSLVFQNPKWAPQRQQLMDMLWRAIFSPDSLTLTSKLALCRVFVGLLYDVGDMEHVRVFFYQVMTSKFLNAPMVAVAIAGVWPQCLYRNSSGASPVLVVMEACIMKELQEVKDRGTKIAECLKRLVNWDLCVHQNNVLLQHLVKEIENKCEDYHSNQDEVFELRRAVELLLVRQKVGFFKTVFVGVAMGTIHSKLRSKKTEAAEHYVRVIIQIAGSVLMQITSMNEKSLSQIIRKYIAKTLMSEQASQELQLSIAQSLLELSFLSPVTVLSGSLYPWFLANKNMIPADFVCRMERTRQTLIGHFPYFRCPEFVI